MGNFAVLWLIFLQVSFDYGIMSRKGRGSLFSPLRAREEIAAKESELCSVLHGRFL